MAERRLVMKLAEVMDAIKHIEKKGWNDHFKYHYATESDVSTKVREELAKRHLMMIPSVLNTELRENKKGSTIATVTMEFKLMDGETGEELTFNFSGEGMDTGDKAVYKAITGTQKYALMKVFQIPTGDDPEKGDGPPPGKVQNNNGQQQQGQQNGNQQQPYNNQGRSQNQSQNRGQSQQNRQQSNQQPQNTGAGQQRQQQPPQSNARPNVQTPQDATIKAKYQQLFGSLNGFDFAPVLHRFEGPALLQWFDERLEEQRTIEPQIFKLSKDNNGNEEKTGLLILKTLNGGGTYKEILDRLTAKINK